MQGTPLDPHKSVGWHVLDDVAFVDSGTRVVLMPLSRLRHADSQPLVLEGSAYAIWNALPAESSRIVAERVISMLDVHDVPFATVQHDVAQLLHSLFENGILASPHGSTASAISSAPDGQDL